MVKDHVLFYVFTVLHHWHAWSYGRENGPISHSLHKADGSKISHWQWRWLVLVTCTRRPEDQVSLAWIGPFCAHDCWVLFFAASFAHFSFQTCLYCSRIRSSKCFFFLCMDPLKSPVFRWACMGSSCTFQNPPCLERRPSSANLFPGYSCVLGLMMIPSQQFLEKLNKII